VLSRGYGKGGRLHGSIVGVRHETLPRVKIPGWAECYGLRAETAICIQIRIDAIEPEGRGR
jgi:hypothetical protein